MRRFGYSFKTRIEYDGPVSLQTFLIRAVPAENMFQSLLSSKLEVEGCDNLCRGADSFGNSLQYGIIRTASDYFEFVSEGVACQNFYRIAEAYNPVFLHETQLTAASPKMREFLAGLPLGGMAGGFEKAALICREISKRIKYQKGATAVGTSAAEAFGLGRGVCQDFAHIALSLCRLAGVPSRYVSGLMAGEGASHAWVEVWDAYAWRALDPANDKHADYGYLKIAHGRDFRDCSLNRGTLSGTSFAQKIISEVKVAELL